MPETSNVLTARSLRTLLEDKVFRTGGRTPTSSAIADLAANLNAHREVLDAMKTPQPTAVKTALQILDEQVPPIRQGLAAALRIFDEAEIPVESRSRTRIEDHMVAVDELLLAIRNFRGRNLDFSLNFSPSRHAWMDNCHTLTMLFKKAMPDAPAMACYRFIAAVTPYLTGEPEPSIPAVKTHITKGR